ncbi:hypothetical protein ACQP1G_34670 [Nocardia sp. CA-107356]|uniref:hypothetical protein n=1 Tax=Nocardia sp. CA-107356 TaxID=3239972 RepID=UPI003D89D2E3
MTDRATSIQLTKLADALHVPIERIEYLGVIGGEHLAALHEQVVNNLRSRYPGEYQRYSALGRQVPMRLAVPFATRVLPPRLLGRSIGGELLDGRTDKSLAVLSNIDPVVVADAAPYMNPAVVGRLAEIAAPELISGVMGELLARKDFDTADLFVDYVTEFFMAAEEPAGDSDARQPRRGLLRRLRRKR